MFNEIIAKSLFLWFENCKPESAYEQQIHEMLTKCMGMNNNDILTAIAKGKEFVATNPDNRAAHVKLICLITIAISHKLEFDQLEFFSEILEKDFMAGR